MGYLLALILPLALLYSPKAEKKNSVFFTRPLVITQERKTPAYYLFQQTQKTLQPENQRLPATINKPVASAVVDLSNSSTVTFKVGDQHLNELKFERAELLAQTEQKLATFASANTDSTLLNQLNRPNPAEPNFDNPIQTNVNGAAVRGQFELKDGVGIVDHIVSLRRVFEGQSIELGQVDLNAGQYQIQVGSFEGELVAEIKDRNGLMIGEDRQRLAGLKRIGAFFQGPLLRLGQPSAFAFNPRSVDDRRLPENDLAGTFFSGNYSLKKTTDIYPNVARHSSTIGFISDKTGKQSSVLTIRSAKDSSETLLFSKKWAEGLQSYLSEKLQIQYMSNAGMIIGRVIVDGKPVAGARVVIENQPGVEPYYLDQFLIPQTNQSLTSANGFFVIPGLTSGSYQISSFIDNRTLGSQLFIADSGVVSYQEINSTNKMKSIIARSFDAFNGEETFADVSLPGETDILSIESGPARYQSRAQSGLQEIPVRGLRADYVPYIYMQSANKDHLHLPLFTEDFLEKIRTMQQINIRPETAVLVGFTSETEYDLHVTDEDYDRRNIAYFDANGTYSPIALQGGGFIVFNLSLGLQEIILQSQKTDRTFSQVVFAKDSQIYVSHFSEY